MTRREQKEGRIAGQRRTLGGIREEAAWAEGRCPMVGEGGGVYFRTVEFGTPVGTKPDSHTNLTCL